MSFSAFLTKTAPTDQKWGNIELEVIMRPYVKNEGVGEFAGKKPLLRATKVSCPMNDPPINM